MSLGPVLRSIGIIAVTLFLLTAFTPLAVALVHWTAVRPRVQPAEAIVVLGGGLSSDGVLSDSSLRNAIGGISLFRKGLAPLLVLSGDENSTGANEAEIRARFAREFGVPPSAILAVVGAKTTRGEADLVGALLQPRGARRILLVADPLHLERAVPAFEHRGLAPLPAPVEPPTAAADSPEGRLTAMRWVLQELLGRIYYRAVDYR